MDALADLPDFDGTIATPERETFRARLLARDVGTMRDRQRARTTARLADWLERIESADTFEEAHRLNHWLFGAVILSHGLDLLSVAEAAEWQRQATEAMRGKR